MLPAAACLQEIPKTTFSFFTSEEIEQLDPLRIPKHVAIIPDGNRRWAKNQSSSAEAGHREGADTLMDVVKAGKELGVKVITFYLFSTENWNRPTEEVAALMWLLQSYLIDQQKVLIESGIRLQTIGDTSKLPEEVVQTIQETKTATAECDQIDMIFALNYGGRDDICRAVQSMIADLKNSPQPNTVVTEDLISRYIDTAPWGDPDLLIRTSGELRVSNFLLWQISYAEFFTTPVLWPDFTPKHLLEALLSFQKRQRRLGGT